MSGEFVQLQHQGLTDRDASNRRGAKAFFFGKAIDRSTNGEAHGLTARAQGGPDWQAIGQSDEQYEEAYGRRFKVGLGV
jgi:hypothetical protein